MDVFLWTQDVGRHGCLNCLKDKNVSLHLLPKASLLIDNNPLLKKNRAQYIAMKI